ncbi:MAG: ABC transporter ATP-binding protein, partial [Clostridiales bacterium]|nr:ABC transporter ATP-binding protein [Clostridiales bacterium]
MILRTKSITLGYNDKDVIKDMSLEILGGDIVSIIGPNGSGKSTLLRGIMRNLKLKEGNIYLYERDIYSYSHRKLGRKVAYLPQRRNCPGDITVQNLISYGRYPHISWRNKWRDKDGEIVIWAAQTTGVKDMLDRPMKSLSGGESQRVWLAMILAQKTDIIILDEPITALDISYQIELLQILKSINESLDMTIVMVLHDINLAAQYSDALYILKDGKIYNSGKPSDIVDRHML